MRPVASSVRVAALAAFLTGAPLVAFLIRFGVAAPLAFFATDAFYYLDIMLHSAGFRGYSFDGKYVTNGFHPLWEYLLTFCQWLHLWGSGDSQNLLIRVFILSVLLLSAGAGMFAAFSARYLQQRGLAFFIAAPGMLWFLGAGLSPVVVSTWSFSNGMESALSLFTMSLALLAWKSVTQSPSRDVLFSVCLGFAILARLDEVFMLVALAVWALWPARLPWKRVLCSIAPAALMIAAYCVYNRVSAGTFLPSSGTYKAGLSYSINFRWTMKLLVPMLTRNAPSAIMAGGVPDSYFSEATRAFLMVFPAVICAIELWLRRRSTQADIIQVLCAGVVLKALYNFVNVAAFVQGPWYYTVSFFTANMVVVIWMDRLLKRATLRHELFTWGIGSTVVAFYAFCTVYAYLAQATGSAAYRTLQRSDSLRAQIEQGGDHCFIEIDDGFLSFALKMPSESGIGLALDAEASRAAKEGRFLPLMRQRGCSLLLSQQYSFPVRHYIETEAWKTGEPFWPVTSAEFQKYKLVPALSIPELDIVGYRIEPR